MIVRIPYVISADGRWCASGDKESNQHPDWLLMEEIADGGKEFAHYQRGWIEVDLPVPSDIPDIKGRAIPERCE